MHWLASARPVELLKVPGWQRLCLGRCEPAAHQLPAGQGVGAVAAGPHQAPAGQAEQTALPVELAKEPGAQGAGCPAPAGQAAPGGQSGASAGDATPPAQKEPATHGSVGRDVFWKGHAKPARQGRHWLCAEAPSAGKKKPGGQGTGAGDAAGQ